MRVIVYEADRAIVFYEKRSDGLWHLRVISKNKDTFLPLITDDPERALRRVKEAVYSVEINREKILLKYVNPFSYNGKKVIDGLQVSVWKYPDGVAVVIDGDNVSFVGSLETVSRLWPCIVGMNSIEKTGRIVFVEEEKSSVKIPLSYREGTVLFMIKGLENIDCIYFGNKE